MLPSLRFAFAATLLPLSLSPPLNFMRECEPTEQALRAVAHAYWAAFNTQNVAALDQLFDDRLLHVTESGALLSKPQLFESVRRLSGSIKVESAEQPENVRIVFHEGLGVMSFTKAFKIIHRPTGTEFGGTSRMTETFVCIEGKWKLLAFQETLVADPARQVYEPAKAYFGDYVGKYRFGADGRGGEITVTKRNDRLYESWGADQPVELLPGKFDMFFTPGFPILERFVRDRRGRVIGIVYMLGDGEVEAKRVQ